MPLLDSSIPDSPASPDGRPYNCEPHLSNHETQEDTQWVTANWEGISQAAWDRRWMWIDLCPAPRPPPHFAVSTYQEWSMLNQPEAYLHLSKEENEERIRICLEMQESSLRYWKAREGLPTPPPSEGVGRTVERSVEPKIEAGEEVEPPTRQEDAGAQSGAEEGRRMGESRANTRDVTVQHRGIEDGSEGQAQDEVSLDDDDDDDNEHDHDWPAPRNSLSPLDIVEGSSARPLDPQVGEVKPCFEALTIASAASSRLTTPTTSLTPPLTISTWTPAGEEEEQPTLPPESQPRAPSSPLSEIILTPCVPDAEESRRSTTLPLPVPQSPSEPLRTSVSLPALAIPMWKTQTQQHLHANPSPQSPSTAMSMDPTPAEISINIIPAILRPPPRKSPHIPPAPFMLCTAQSTSTNAAIHIAKRVSPVPFRLEESAPISSSQTASPPGKESRSKLAGLSFRKRSDVSAAAGGPSILRPSQSTSPERNAPLSLPSPGTSVQAAPPAVFPTKTVRNSFKVASDHRSPIGKAGAPTRKRTRILESPIPEEDVMEDEAPERTVFGFPKRPRHGNIAGGQCISAQSKGPPVSANVPVPDVAIAAASLDEEDDGRDSDIEWICGGSVSRLPSLAGPPSPASSMGSIPSLDLFGDHETAVAVEGVRVDTPLDVNLPLDEEDCPIGGDDEDNDTGSEYDDDDPDAPPSSPRRIGDRRAKRHLAPEIVKRRTGRPTRKKHPFFTRSSLPQAPAAILHDSGLVPKGTSKAGKWEASPGLYVPRNEYWDIQKGDEQDFEAIVAYLQDNLDMWHEDREACFTAFHAEPVQKRMWKTLYYRYRTRIDTAIKRA